MPRTKQQTKKLAALGARLRALREQKGLTLRDLGYKIGKEPQSLHRLETGAINPSYLYLLEVCVGLEIEITDLLNKLV